MLIDFRIKNYRSIKNDQLLSMVAAKQNEHAMTHTFSPDASSALNLVKTAVIYGANAAGKSNVIKALKTMREIVVQSGTKYQRGDTLPLQPFLLDTISKTEPTEFEVNFIFDNIRYQYGFSATSEHIMSEWLIAYPKGRPQNWFAREFDSEALIPSYKWQFGDKFTGKKQLWQEATRDNALFLSTAVQLNSDQLKPVFDWFAKTLHIAGIFGWSPDFTVKLCQENDHKQEILKFLRTADMDIEDIEIETAVFDPLKIPEDIPVKIRKEIIREMQGKTIIKDLKMVHSDNEGQQIAFDINDESDGTRKLFAFIGPWLNSLENGHVILIDELHDNFHPMMVKFLIDLFHNTLTNKSNAQLVFTTHETSILDQDQFRRDQVWFCEKKAKATTLYPLTDFSPRKGAEDLAKGYLSGRYGALPYFKNITMAMGYN